MYKKPKIIKILFWLHLHLFREYYKRALVKEYFWRGKWYNPLSWLDFVVAY